MSIRKCLNCYPRFKEVNDPHLLWDHLEEAHPEIILENQQEIIKQNFTEEEAE